MDRNECITLLMAAGMTWNAATCLFHESIAWRPVRQRWFWVEHYCELCREDAALRVS